MVNLFMGYLDGSTANNTLLYDTVRQYDSELTKVVFNILFEIYSIKANTFNLALLEHLHRDIEYYARRQNMLGLVTACCMEMGLIYCSYCRYEEGREQFERALQLAVVIGDKYTEEVAIDKMGLC